MQLMQLTAGSIHSLPLCLVVGAGLEVRLWVVLKDTFWCQLVVCF